MRQNKRKGRIRLILGSHGDQKNGELIAKEMAGAERVFIEAAHLGTQEEKRRRFLDTVKHLRETKAHDLEGPELKFTRGLFLNIQKGAELHFEDLSPIEDRILSRSELKLNLAFKSAFTNFLAGNLNRATEDLRKGESFFHDQFVRDQNIADQLEKIFVKNPDKDLAVFIGSGHFGVYRHLKEKGLPVNEKIMGKFMSQERFAELARRSQLGKKLPEQEENLLLLRGMLEDKLLPRMGYLDEHIKRFRLKRIMNKMQLQDFNELSSRLGRAVKAGTLQGNSEITDLIAHWLVRKGFAKEEELE